MSNKLNLSLFVSPNDDDNLTVSEAKEMISLMTYLGIPYDVVVVQQGTSNGGPEDEITFAQLLAARPTVNAKFFIVGRYKSDADDNGQITKGYTLAKDKSFLYIPQADGAPAKRKDPVNALVDLMTNHYPGSSRSQIETMLEQIPDVKMAVQVAIAEIRDIVQP